ncbi:MAG: hypothetical protein MAG431_00198 [Chloroflexi bacterium]|nr:hypothetical protein [Chloroflexota bacterium]
MAEKNKNPFIINTRLASAQAPDGSHTVDYNFPTLHFEPDLDLQNFDGTVTAIVSDDGIMVEGGLTAETELACTRCLCTFTHQVKISFAELYVYSRSKEKIEDEGDLEIHLLPADGYIDVKPLYRQYALLDIPIKHVCSSECKGLCPTCGCDLNKEDCGHRQEKIDPRMAVLGQLLEEEE